MNGPNGWRVCVRACDSIEWNGKKKRTQPKETVGDEDDKIKIKTQKERIPTTIIAYVRANISKRVWWVLLRATNLLNAATIRMPGSNSSMYSLYQQIERLNGQQAAHTHRNAYRFQICHFSSKFVILLGGSAIRTFNYELNIYVLNARLSTETMRSMKMSRNSNDSTTQLIAYTRATPHFSLFSNTHAFCWHSV